MTTIAIDGTPEAYDEHYVLDNKLMLEWYPQRVVAMARERQAVPHG